ncbi:MAG: gluconate 2-dehydrogenase subunit 3 family protein [Bacteroidetes bacterium]|nr:gluconate 2-dehydrogenase subunit 3 family protein [Bacteroidota bacterium]
MDRRASLKTLLIGGLSASVIAEACKNADKVKVQKQDAASTNDADRMPEEKAYNKKLKEEVFFTTDEMATISVLADIIIPKDEVSGSASDVKVPEFIEFIVKDQPEHQVPMRGGIRWLELESIKRFDKSFNKLAPTEQLQIVDDIAYPEKAKKEFSQGVSFFTLMRNLTISGFYTTEVGFKDVGYMGNRPNQWNGVPDDVLKKYNLAYTEKELKECISYNKAPGA